MYELSICGSISKGIVEIWVEKEREQTILRKLERGRQTEGTTKNSFTLLLDENMLISLIVEEENA